MTLVPNRENTTRVCKEVGKRKQKNSQEEWKTKNVTSAINYTSEIIGHELGKCDMSNGQG